jgi:hypothetical protein
VSLDRIVVLWLGASPLVTLYFLNTKCAKHDLEKRN